MGGGQGQDHAGRGRHQGTGEFWIAAPAALRRIQVSRWSYPEAQARMVIVC